jgi:hypothetical protein
MALAILRPKGRDGERVQFDIELGRNRYYSYAVGDGELDRTQGFGVLLNRKVTSSLLGPIADHPSGRATLEIPVEEFDRTNRYVQLATFRTPGREGPAVSEIVTVSLGSILRDGGDFPTLSLGMGSHMAVNTQRQPVPFKYSEARPISQAMFLGALLPILQNALPIVSNLLPVVGKLFGGGGAAGGGTAVAAQPSPQIDQILGLLQQFLAQMAASKGGPAIQQSLAFGDQYSMQQNPALLAAAPMLEKLMPLLQQVLTPETVKAVVDSVSPVKMIGAVKDGLMEVGKLGLDNNKELNRFLKSLDPGVDDPGLDRLLESMSVKAERALARSLAGGDTRDKQASKEPMYQRVTSVSLDFTGVEAQLVGGRTRLCYRHGGKLSFPLSVTTPRPIRGARFHLLVKNPATREILKRERLAVPEVAAGPLAVTPVLEAEAVRALVPGEEYLVCAYLLWRDKHGRVLGTSRTQLITLVGQYSLDRVEDEGPLIPLNDITKHRDFWHKIWQGSFTNDFRRATFECKYYMLLEPGRQEHARMETLTKLDQPVERKLVGRLKSGFLASPAALNRLIPLVSSHPMLNDDELAALRSPDFVARFHQAARFKANLHGRPGASAAVWVYPEIKMQKVVLYEATKVGDAGQVREFAEHVVHVPIPALLHYIGARTTS